MTPFEFWTLVLVGVSAVAVREALEVKIERLRKNHFAGMEVMRSFALEIIESLAAPGEPCAWRYRSEADADDENAWEVVPHETCLPTNRDGYVVEPLYRAPQPAAGWDEAINAAMATIEKMRVAGACNFSDARHQGQRGADYLDTLYDACQAVKALRREAPAPDEIYSCLGYDQYPTHWQPLPAPPLTAASDGEVG